MKKSSKIILIVIAALVVLLVGSAFSSYNKMVAGEEKVQSAYADIDTQLQRRADLIPNLVNAVKGYMEHETSVIESITQSRERLMSAGTLEEKAEANDALTSALSNLNIVVENYPDLKANTNFIQLQDELAGTENRIATARRDYNDAVRNYNQSIKAMPGRIFASLFGFAPADYFAAKEGSDEVPNVIF